MTKALLILTVIFLTSCAENNWSPISSASKNGTNETETPPRNSAPPAPGNSPEIVDDQQICYPAQTNGTTCVPLLLRPQSFPYLDPWSDPSFPGHLDPLQYRLPVKVISVTNLILDEQVTEHFQWSELVHPRKGDFAVVASSLMDHLEAIRSQAQSPIIINSGYRGPSYNSTIPGAAKWSRHQYGDAVDFYSPNHSLLELKQICQDQNASFIQVYNSHIHCDWRKEPVSPDFYGHPNDFPLSPSSFQSFTSSSSISVSILSHQIHRLTAEHPASEDGEGLYYHWEVHSLGRNSSTEHFYDKSINWFHRHQSYHIKLNIGQTAVLEQTFHP